METLDYKYLAELVLKAKSGSSNAFAELYAATYSRQYRYSYRYLKDEFLAQDALQDTFVQVLRNLSKLQDPELFLPWVSRINFRVCYDIQKRENAAAAGAAAELQDKETAGKTPWSDPETESIRIDTNSYILNQVMSLPLTESQVVLMHYYQNMPLNEIAQHLNISRSTVKRYLRSGKERLSKLLFDIHGEEVAS